MDYNYSSNSSLCSQTEQSFHECMTAPLTLKTNAIFLNILNCTSASK